MSDLDPTRELHLCWQDTIEEVSLEEDDEEIMSSGDEEDGNQKTKVKNLVRKRGKAVSSRKSAAPISAKNSSKPNNAWMSLSNSSKLILPKSNFTKISKSCKVKIGGSGPSISGQKVMRTAYNAYSSTSRISHSASSKIVGGATTTPKSHNNLLRKTAGSTTM